MDQTDKAAATARAEKINQAFTDISRTLVTDFDLADALDQVIGYCVSAGGATGVGIVIEDEYGRLRDIAYSDDGVRRLERLQIETAEGPCVQSVRLGRAVVEADLLTAEDRWLRFAPAATAAGFQAVRALPLRFRSRTLGALNLFDDNGDQCSPELLRAAQALADLAVLAIVQHAHAHAHQDATAPITRALAGRTLIEQAKGMLAEDGHLTMQQAHDRLRDHAARTGQHTTRLAYALVHGDLSTRDLLQPQR